MVPPSVMQNAVLLGCDRGVHFNSRSFRSLPPRPSDQRVSGELELVHHAPTDMSDYTIDPAASGGGFHLRYEGAAGVTLSDDPQLLAASLVRSDGSPALAGHYLVDMMPQSDLPSVEEQFVASGRHVLPLVGVVDLEPGDTPTGLSEVSLVSTVMASPLAASVSPSPALFERLSPEQRASFLRVWARLPSHLQAEAFDLHDTDRTPEAIEQLGDVLCKFPNVFSKSKSEFGSCSLVSFVILVAKESAPAMSRPHRINPIMAEEMEVTLDQYLAEGLIQHLTSPYSIPLMVIPRESGGVRITVNQGYN